MIKNNIAWNPTNKGKMTKSETGFEPGTFCTLAGRSATELFVQEAATEKI